MANQMMLEPMLDRYFFIVVVLFLLLLTSSLSASAWSLSTAGARSPDESALRNMIFVK